MAIRFWPGLARLKLPGPRSPVAGEMAFVFTGAAAAHGGMGRGLLLALPSLWAECTKRSLPIDEKIIELIYGGHNRWHEDPVGQLIATSLLCQLHATLTLDLFDLEPTAVLGLSSGESNALFAFGVWKDISLSSDIRSSGIYGRLLMGDCRAAAKSWSLSDNETVRWRNWHLLAPLEEVRRAVAEEPRGVPMSPSSKVPPSASSVARRTPVGGS
uniref:Uncharacterized protein n=1 Tax=Candidatus Kentrum sp. LFY TaxID=2126342 RepID=A0A450WCN7_9GAMM|nr:MAG: hypothetical protein BECKLFY1418C_GA0070996_101114 [Candidatus Kentron sp. LFY]